MTHEQEHEPVHLAWFRSIEQEISEEYERLHRKGREDPHRAGLGGEKTWASILKRWLPEAYQVVTRRYIVPEIDTGIRVPETDIVVLRPSYPAPLRDRNDVLAGGVAAAFSVKLGLNGSGAIEEAVKQAADLRRTLRPRRGSPRDEILAPFPFGLLAHSHNWKGERSAVGWKVYELFNKFDEKLIDHPRESLDYICVADLDFWSTMRVAYLAPGPRNIMAKTAQQRAEGVALSGIGQMAGSTPFASFIAHLIARLSYTDPTLKPLKDNFLAMEVFGGMGAQGRVWDLSAVYTETTRHDLLRMVSRGEPNIWDVALS